MEPPGLPTIHADDMIAGYSLLPDKVLQKEYNRLNVLKVLRDGRRKLKRKYETYKVYSLYKPDVPRYIDTRGLPSKCRGQVWLALLDAEEHLERSCEEYEFFGSDLFTDQTEDAATDASHWRDASIKQPKAPTFGKITPNDKFYLRSEGVRARARVLYVFQEMHPHIQYCPMIPPIVTVLLHYLPEDHVYAALVAMFSHGDRSADAYTATGHRTPYESGKDRRKYSGSDNAKKCAETSWRFLWHGKNAHAQNLFVMEEIAWEYLSPYWFDFVRWQLLWDSELVYLKEDILTENVLLTRFLTHWTDLVLERMPFYCIVRILDQFFLHGPKILFRACLAMMLSTKEKVREKLGPAFDLAESILKTRSTKEDDMGVELLQGEERAAPAMRSHEIANPPLNLTMKEKLMKFKKQITRRTSDLGWSPSRSSVGRASMGGISGSSSPTGRTTVTPRRSIDAGVMRPSAMEATGSENDKTGHLTVVGKELASLEASANILGVTVAEARSLLKIIATVEREVNMWNAETRVEARQLRMVLAGCEPETISQLCVRFHVTAHEISMIRDVLATKELDQVRAERRRIYGEEGSNLKKTRNRPLPKLAGSTSRIMDDVMLGDMWAYAPDRLHLDNLRLAFCTWKHGYNINMLYSQCDDVSPMFLLVKTTSDTSGRVFGAYITEPLTKRHSTRGYFGSGESFVFSLDPHSQKFDWVGTEKMRVRALALAKGEFVSDDGDDINKAHSFFTQANNDMIMIGGGDSGHAILINSDLSEGSTNKNATYTNPPFVEQVQFHIADVEVWCLASDVGTIMQHAGEHTPVYNHGS